MDKQEELLMVCFCCRNYACEGYTMFRGYLVCEYCLDEWLKSEGWRKNEDFEVWCINHKKELDDELKQND